MTFYRQNCLNLREYASICFPMASSMPEGLRKHMESKEERGEHGKKDDEKSEMKRREALRKAKKAKTKRHAEKEAEKR